MARERRRKRDLTGLAPAFTIAAPSGARIRDRLRPAPEDEKVLRLVGEHLGRCQRADLAERVRIGQVTPKDARRAERKRKLTAVSSSRWAGAMTRASEDQYQLSMRCLYDERVGLRRAIGAITRRLAAPCGKRAKNGVRGYADQNERVHKQRRRQVLEAKLAVVEQKIAAGQPSIVAGGRRLAKLRHHLADACLSEAEWRDRWEAERLFITADGESGAPHGNYTITVDPADGTVTLVLPEPLRHLSNAPRGRYQFACTVTFHHRRDEWLDRVTAHRAVRYDIIRDSARGRWHLDASWAAARAMPPTPSEIKARGERLLGVDLNADHLAACVIDMHGNPVGAPVTIPLRLAGPASTRDGRLRAAISQLITMAGEHGCVGIAIEDLGFAEARQAGRETMGRGRRGKKFRRTVADIPTARFRERLRGMAYHAGLVVIAVDPAFTSRWGGQHWTKSLQEQSKKAKVTRHHAAGVAIGRRDALGHGIRRRPGVTAHHRRMVMRRATGQATSLPRARGAASPPRTAGTPTPGGKTRPRRGDQLTLFPDLEDRSRGHRTT
ncbi:transposase [Streptomyces spinoverrucosus]|uniref:Transposase n=1 Tax=Streptomyces spinoverrucosus TaxID=284043 RepID=A0A4Y3VUV3_9ACTN|nr:transposase [Streptomyces spinoverrucosus]GHB86595.1 transposase [Streptomyces spinoverrucosus]